MTTPAVSANVQSYSANQSYTYQVNGVGPETTVIVGPSIIGGVRDIRPASGTSPIRADGTRAPRAWQHRWADMRSYDRNVVWQYPIAGGNVRVCRGKLNIASVPWDTILTRAGGNWASLSSPPAFPISIESAARTRFLTKLADGKMQLGATLGEIAQTGRMIRSLASDVIGGVDRVSNRVGLLREDAARLLTGKKLRKMPKSEFLRIKRLAPELISRWLELQFGLRPLFQDIEDAGSVLSTMIFDEMLAAKLQVRSGYSEIERRVISVDSPVTGASWSLDQPVLLETSCHISGVYNVPITANRTFAQLGLTNPMSVLWELTLLSWMVDYLTTTGAWIGSMTATQGTTFVEASMSRIQRVSTAGPYTFREKSAGVLGNSKLLSGFGPGMLHLTGGRFDRVILGTVAPGLMPTVKNRLDLDKMANVLAALASLTGGTQGKLRI